MSRILSMCSEAGFAALFLLPLFLCLKRKLFHRTGRSIWYFFFALYLCAMYAVAGLPSVCYIRFDPNYNLTPFAYMFSDYENSFLNILLFIPLGFLLPVFWKSFHGLSRTLLFGFCGSVLIELLQLFSYRATDINDLITNSMGTLIGWIWGRLFLLLFPSVKPGWKTKEVYLICIISFFTMFFVQPFLVKLFNSACSFFRNTAFLDVFLF